MNERAKYAYGPYQVKQRYNAHPFGKLKGGGAHKCWALISIDSQVFDGKFSSLFVIDFRSIY